MRHWLAAFGRWLVERDYLPEDPLRRLKKIDTTPITVRRALTIAEIERLLQHCAPERRLLYQVALTTGLRAGELRHITPAHLDVDSCALRLESAWTKNRKDRLQHVPSWLMDDLLKAAEGVERDDQLLAIPFKSCRTVLRQGSDRGGYPEECPR